MARETYTLFTIDPNSEFGAHAKEITVTAENHIQHTPYETRLEGISRSGAKRIQDTFSGDDVVYTTVGGRDIKLVG